jgi:hypothetical protein
MRAFERFFCATNLTDDDVNLAYLEALEADRQLATMDAGQRSKMAEELTVWRAAHQPASIRRDEVLRQRQALQQKREAALAERAAVLADKRRQQDAWHAAQAEWRRSQAARRASRRASIAKSEATPGDGASS